MDKKVKVIFEGKTRTSFTYEEAIEKAEKMIYEQSKKYTFVSTNEAKYGRCPECGCKLEPVWYEEPEDETLYTFQFGKTKGYTGRYHRAVDYLLCNNCGHAECVDGSFDDHYYYRKDN